jgi:sarcosine oxidase subunit alpha
VYDGGTYGALERVADHLPEPAPHQPRQRLWRILAKRAVLTAGAIERPLLFDGNDKPGVMLAGAVRTYLNKYGAASGRRAVVFAANDDAARTVADLAEAGVEVRALVDPRGSSAGAAQRIARLAGAEFFAGASIRRATGGPGGVRGVQIERASGDHVNMECDLVAMSGGWNPTLHLATNLGHKPRWRDDLAAFVPDGTPPGLGVAGAAAGAFSLAECLATGARAGLVAAEAAGFHGQALGIPDTDEEFAGQAPHWHVHGRASTTFVDFQNDVSAKDVMLARKEGFHAVEHLKRYTTLGMATDQGKTANVNGLALMAELTQRTIPAVGTTGFRPPYTPVAIAAFAGPHRERAFRPTRLTPTHRWAEARGAVFVEAGQWLRAQYFPRPGERDWLETVTREVRAVRGGVGFCDVTTLGKIDVQGDDAGIFLDRVCVNTFSKLPVGRVRYALLLREDGFVMDDGTAARLAEDHYVMTASTAHAGAVYQHLQYCRQVLWPELDVQLASVTEQWAQIAVAGPNSRRVIRKLVDSAHDVSREAFPPLAAAELSVCGGVRARLFAVSFSGELAFELAVPARFGEALADALMRAGEEFAIMPYGTEALGVMRVEKGFPAGNELNGQVSAHDLGLQKLMAKKDFVGKVMAARPALTDPDRQQLVGLRPSQPGSRFRGGAHLVPRGAPADAANDQGYITSVVYSPTVGEWIALAYLARGPRRHGETVRVVNPLQGEDFDAVVCAPVFVDPEGARMNG